MISSNPMDFRITSMLMKPTPLQSLWFMWRRSTVTQCSNICFTQRSRFSIQSKRSGSRWCENPRPWRAAANHNRQWLCWWANGLIWYKVAAYVFPSNPKHPIACLTLPLGNLTTISKSAYPKLDFRSFPCNCLPVLVHTAHDWQHHAPYRTDMKS